MSTGAEPSIARLLEETGAAHGVYETTALGGVYDESWPDWYATYLIEHGLADHLPRAGTLDAPRLSALLKQLDADYRRLQPADDWPAYYAQRLSAMVA